MLVTVCVRLHIYIYSVCEINFNLFSDSPLVNLVDVLSRLQLQCSYIFRLFNCMPVTSTYFTVHTAESISGFGQFLR